MHSVKKGVSVNSQGKEGAFTTFSQELIVSNIGVGEQETSKSSTAKETSFTASIGGQRASTNSWKAGLIW